MEFERTLRRTPAAVSWVSLVDVLFLLLVFFMLSSSFMVSEAMVIDMPKGAVPVSDTAKPIVVVADRGRVFMDNLPATLEQIEGRAGPAVRANPAQRFIVMSTPQANVQELVAVMDTIYKAGGSYVSLSGWE